jgi:hypothetical protein
LPAGKIGFANYGEPWQGYQIAIDDVRVRKYASPEPVWATWGTAEEQPGTDRPNITSWQNNKTNNASLTLTIIGSEIIHFNATANQTIDVWNWFKDGVNATVNFDNYTTSFISAGAHTVKVNATNTANGTSDTITWNITILTNTPNITSWENNKTSNSNLMINVTTVEDIKFNVTANQTISTWSWFKDDANQNNNQETFTTSFTAGLHTVKVNATNPNGTSNTITWDINSIASAPNITSWSNNKTSNLDLNIAVNVSEVVNFNATANQTIVTWSWFKDDANQSHNFDNFTTSFSTNTTHTIKVNATNSNGVSNTITWTTTNIGNPNITSWENNKTNDASLTISFNNTDNVRFNATANQSIITWSWFRDNINQSHNFDNFTTNFSTVGAHTIKVNATSVNGISNTITWTSTIAVVNTTSAIREPKIRPAQINWSLVTGDAYGYVCIMTNKTIYINITGCTQQ